MKIEHCKLRIGTWLGLSHGLAVLIGAAMFAAGCSTGSIHMPSDYEPPNYPRLEGTRPMGLMGPVTNVVWIMPIGVLDFTAEIGLADGGNLVWRRADGQPPQLSGTAWTGARLNAECGMRNAESISLRTVEIGLRDGGQVVGRWIEESMEGEKDL